MAMEISSIGSGFLAHRSWISRGYLYRELGLIQLLNQSHMSAAGLHFPGVKRGEGAAWDAAGAAMHVCAFYF